MNRTVRVELASFGAALLMGAHPAIRVPNAAPAGAPRVAGISVVVASPRKARAGDEGVVLDAVVPPGTNFERAAFRLWYPKSVAHFKAILLLVPGSNGDGRAMVDDTVWQQFATRHDLALVALNLTDKQHEQSFIEHYINVSQGSGDALFTALSSFATKANHPELNTAPFLLWGMSAGGEFNYEFTAWKPERVLAFVVNKGGIYYTALASRAARNVPGLLFIGGKDLDSRKNIITGLWALNRRGAALWALAEEPSAAHIVGRSRDVALMFYEDVLNLRLGDADGTPGPMRDLEEKTGYLGDLKAKTIRAVTDSSATNYNMVWLPTARVAKAWLAMVTEQPF